MRSPGEALVYYQIVRGLFRRMLIGTLVYGFVNSAILALIAMGFNLTFGISGVANFAYGAVYIFSGFLPGSY